MADAVIIDDGGSTRIKHVLTGDGPTARWTTARRGRPAQAREDVHDDQRLVRRKLATASGRFDRKPIQITDIVVQSGNKQKVIGLWTGAKKLSHKTRIR